MKLAQGSKGKHAGKHWGEAKGGKMIDHGGKHNSPGMQQAPTSKHGGHHYGEQQGRHLADTDMKNHFGLSQQGLY